MRKRLFILLDEANLDPGPLLRDMPELAARVIRTLCATLNRRFFREDHSCATMVTDYEILAVSSARLGRTMRWQFLQSPADIPDNWQDRLAAVACRTAGLTPAELRALIGQPPQVIRDWYRRRAMAALAEGRDESARDDLTVAHHAVETGLPGFAALDDGAEMIAAPLHIDLRPFLALSRPALLVGLGPSAILVEVDLKAH